MTETDRVTRSAGVGRRRLLALLLVAALVAAAWTAAWAFARTRLIAEIDARLAALAAAGVEVVCPERSVGGWPFGFDVACRDPGVAIAARGIGGSVSAARVAVRIWSPWAIHVEADGPLVGEEAGAGRLDANWRRLSLTLRWRPARVDELTLSVEGLDATVRAADGRGGHLKAEHLETRGRAVGEPARDVEVAVATSSAALELGGKPVGPPRSDLAITATLRDVLPLGPGEPARAFAARGGRIDPIRTSFSVAGLRIAGKGALRLGDDGLLDGTIGFAAEGLEAGLREPVALGPETTSLVAGFVLLGKPSRDADLPGRRLDLVVDHGRPRFGRLVLPAMAPLFRP